MRIAQTLKDLPVGTPVELEGLKLYKGLVCEVGWSSNYRQQYIKILFADGVDIIYYEEDLKEEGIMIVEVICG